MEVPLCWGSVSERLDIFGNFQEPTAIPSRKEEVSVPEFGVSEVGVSEDGVCYKIICL